MALESWRGIIQLAALGVEPVHPLADDIDPVEDLIRLVPKGALAQHVALGALDQLVSGHLLSSSIS
jgi:hypothetical protein